MRARAKTRKQPPPRINSTTKNHFMCFENLSANLKTVKILSKRPHWEETYDIFFILYVLLKIVTKCLVIACDSKPITACSYWPLCEPISALACTISALSCTTIVINDVIHVAVMQRLTRKHVIKSLKCSCHSITGYIGLELHICPQANTETPG